MSFESPAPKSPMPSPARMPKRTVPAVTEIDSNLAAQQVIPELGEQPMIYSATDLQERLIRSSSSWSRENARTIVSALGNDPRVETVGAKFLLYRVFPDGQQTDEAQEYKTNEYLWQCRLGDLIGSVAVPPIIDARNVRKFIDRSTSRYTEKWGQPTQPEAQVVKAWAASFMHEPTVLRTAVDGNNVVETPRRRLLNALHDHYQSLACAGVASTSYEQIRSLAFWETADASTRALFMEQLPVIVGRAGFKAISEDTELLLALPNDNRAHFLERAESIHAGVNDIVHRYVAEGWLSISSERIAEQLRTVLDVPAEHATLPLACLQNHPLLRQEDETPDIFTIVQKGL